MRAAPPEEEWIARARAGDRAAFDDLVRLHFRHVNAFLYRLTPTREDAEDLAQETFVRAHAALAEYRGDARFSTWLLKIALNLAQDERRRSARRGRPEPIEAASGTPDRSPAPGDASEGVELQEQVRAAIRELPVRLRAVLVLRSIEGREYDEIARIVGLRPETVRTQVMEARRELGRRLGPHLRGGTP